MRGTYADLVSLTARGGSCSDLPRTVLRGTGLFELQNPCVTSPRPGETTGFMFL